MSRRKERERKRKKKETKDKWMREEDITELHLAIPKFFLKNHFLQI